ncbi:MAG TPA: TlpA disulfide reductase family protein [Thermoanaerobaculia bacterium]|nr:TlpA disulfide reductase family protein [Thermoanaerobaculia bacterium]
MRALPFLFLLAVPAFATEYVGQLKSEPVPGPAYMVFDLAPVPRAELPMLPAAPAAEDRVFAGSFRITPDHPELRVVLVEPPQGEPWLYADGDLDGKLSAAERFPLGDVLLKLPPVKPPGRPFPVVLHPIPPRDEARRMNYSRNATMEGPVQLGMMEMLVRYPVDPRTGLMSLKGQIGMDVDDDGIIEPALSAGEVKSDAGDGPPIFRMRDSYFSTASIDPATGRVVVKTHPASDYKQFDLRPGAELPDFEFTDLEGRQRRFSELRGKVVLLDFWSTWCAPCVMEMPVLRKVQQDLGGRGFVILGMDVEDELETQKKLVAEQGLSWIHATSASVQDIILKRFGVDRFPTHILVDREGLIVSVGDPGQRPLKKESLPATVEEVVSRKPPVEYVGRLGEPVPQSGPGLPQKLDPAPPELLEALPVRPAPEDRVYSGNMRVLRRSKLDAQVVLVEPPQGKPFLYADVDLDGKLSAAERFDFGNWPGLKEGWGAALLHFRMSTGRIPYYPVLLSWNPEVSAQPKDQPRSLIRAASAYFEGTVPVEGREVKVRYPLNAEAADVEFRQGILAMDLDGDGTFSKGLVAGETRGAFGDREPVIFRLGDLYLSTRSVDAAAGRIVLRTHAASEYRRFELRSGSQVPDFEYTDLQGRNGRLSELRGKVVLLDFWGAWCSSCVAEMPGLRKAYETYRERGFEILGMDSGDKPQEQRRLVAEKGLPWLHATAASVEDVVTRGFEVWSFPTKILLDREGRVLAVVDEDRTEEGLMKMLEAALGGKAEETAAGPVR